MSNNFSREERYIVMKISDIEKYLSGNLLKTDITVSQRFINYGREEDGKLPLSCVVIESDWPEYEVVWKLLEERYNGEQQ